MKRRIVLVIAVAFILTLMLAGCVVPPVEETPSEDPTSYPATKAEDIVGVWEHAFMGSTTMIRYAEDGTLYYYLGSPPREQALGEYWFEDEKLHFAESIAGLDVIGIYSVTVDTENGEPVHLSLSVIEDASGERIRDFEAGLTRTELPADVVLETE